MFGSLRQAEIAFRRFRNEHIYRPIANSRRIQREFETNLAIAAIDFGDHVLAFDPKDKTIAAHIRERGGYFKDETLNVFSALPRRGGVFVDVGANIGTQTVYALKLGGFDRAVCFEPEPRNLKLLRTNLILNDIADRVTVIPAAAGATPGHAMLSLHPTNSGAHSLAISQDGESIQVDVVTVSDTLSALGIAPQDIGLGWIDAEGYEKSILAAWPVGGFPLFMELSADRTTAADVAKYARWSVVRDGAFDWRPIKDFASGRQAYGDVLFMPHE